MKLLHTMKSLVLFSVLAASISFAHAQERDELAQELSEKLQLRINTIADSPIPGLLQLYTDRGLFYASADGHYFLQARVYNIQDGIVDETELALKDMRLEGAKRFKDTAIEFKAKDEKYVVNVFTDATCGYCRKLHNEIAEYNNLGITVRYLSYPRAGLGSQVYKDAISIWCSKDPQDAITKAKAGEQVAAASCENEVAEQYNFGQQIGVNGTPNIILPDGTMIPGYQPPKDLAETLANLSS